MFKIDIVWVYSTIMLFNIGIIHYILQYIDTLNMYWLTYN